MLYIHTSNQLEQLKNQYATVTKTPLQNALKVETVVVQNAGMARWLSMEMSQISGISANTEFLFPAEFMWGLLRLVSPDIPEHSQCAPDTLRFHIFDEILNHYQDYPELHHYILEQSTSIDSESLTQKINQQSVWDLSCQTAKLLDQYLFYRSEWISKWEENNFSEDENSSAAENSSYNHTEAWQSRLWNRCVKDKKLSHWLVLQKQFAENIDEIDSSLLAERISFFSMSALSPGYVDLLGGIAQKTDIHIFIINPCEDIYWGDIRSPKSHAKLGAEEQIYTDIGNPLLASLGKQGQDFIDKLLDIPHGDTDDLYHKFDNESECHSLLDHIQHDIFNLAKPEIIEHLDEADDSIQFNSCHTAMREVEVLHDQLLSQLDSDADLRPSDIVVMMPDIEKYAPYIESVFASSIPTNDNDQGKKRARLPFSIADRDPQNIFKITQALNKLLSLPDSRFDVESVFELLEYDDLREHFGLEQEQLNYCRELALATNIRWGISDKTRKTKDLPNTEEHTWKYALDRMLLGYSLADTNQDKTLFRSNRNLDLLAYSEIEGSNAITLAKFKSFTDAVFAINEWEALSLTLEDWITKTNTLILKLTPESPDQQRIFKSLADLQLKANLAEFDQELPYSVYQTMLQQSLSDITSNEKYLGYGITFCALVPMRSVPFSIVALMGMNDGEFPRQETRPSFDLMANSSRKGDRSRRDEDRYLFLESLLAARSKLIISYIGQSIKDNTDIAPSILVSELLDTITSQTSSKAEDWINKHPLQAFSTRYFSKQQITKHPLFSYAAQYLQLKDNSETNSDKNSEEFISEPLIPLDEDKTLTLSELISFYRNPAKAFLQKRFSIQTYDNEKELKNREPFKLESFTDREIRDLIFENIAESATSESESIDSSVSKDSDKGSDKGSDKQSIARAEGLLPYGQIGDELYTKENNTVDTFRQELPDAEFYADLQKELTIGEFKIIVKLDHLSSIGRYVKQVGTPYTGDYIGAWLTHLCLNAIDSEYNKHSLLYTPETSFRFPPIENAQQQLQTLLDYYWQGLHYPLKFYPKSSFALLSKVVKEDYTAMNEKWNGNDRFSGEKESFENWLLHRNIVIDKEQQPEEFLKIGNDLFKNMFMVLEEL